MSVQAKTVHGIPFRGLENISVDTFFGTAPLMAKWPIDKAFSQKNNSRLDKGETRIYAASSIRTHAQFFSGIMQNGSYIA